MGPIERFTRDDASKYVWASLMLAAILALVFALTTGSDAVQDEQQASERRAVAAVDEVLDPRVDASDLAAPITDPTLSSLREAVERSILSDRRVTRVRIWSAEGRLLFSTDRDEAVGSNGALNDEILRRAADGTTLTRGNLSDIGGLDEAGRSLVRTYTPIGSNAVVEVDQAEEGTVAPVRAAWLRYQLLAGAMVLLFLLLTVLSLRDPIERINTGVPFAVSSIPAGFSLIDDERLHAVGEVYRLAHDRVARLEEKLAASETMRRRLEGDIQRALTKAATGMAKPDPAAAATPLAVPPPAATPPAATRPVPMTPAAANGVQAAETGTDAPRPAPATKRPSRPPAAKRLAASAAPASPAPADVVNVPDSEVLGDAWAAAPAGPLARAIRDDPTSPVLRPNGRPEKPKRPPRLKRKPDPVAPVVVAAPPMPEPAIDDEKAHEAALETFIRLTERDRQQADAVDVDQGAVRAALARTAARKKPGGQRLQPHDEPPGESSGGPPRRQS
jgi:hypothetical protein